MKVECEAAGRDYVAEPRNVKQNVKRWSQAAARHQHVMKMQARRQQFSVALLPPHWSALKVSVESNPLTKCGL